MQLGKNLALILVAMVMLTACENKYFRTETGGTERTRAHLDPSFAVLVTTPKDGGFSGKMFSGSGGTVAREIDASLSRYARIVDVFPGPFNSVQELAGYNAPANYGYVIVPIIHIWDRKTTGVKKEPAQVSIKLTIYDAVTGKEMSSNFLEAKAAFTASFLDYFSPEKDDPEDLLAPLLDRYVDNLYGSVITYPDK
jgi:hypothetical protein